MAKARAGTVFTCGVLLPTPSSRMNKLEHMVPCASQRTVPTLHVNSCAREGVSEDCSCWLSTCLSNLGTSRRLLCSLCSCFFLGHSLDFFICCCFIRISTIFGHVFVRRFRYEAILVRPYCLHCYSEPLVSVLGYIEEFAISNKPSAGTVLLSHALDFAHI